MAYGIIKVDTITFTDGGVDKSVSISGLVQNPTFSGNITVTGTISGNLVQGQTISGVTVTGTTAQFTSGTFTSITGGVATITSGVFASGTAAAPSVSVGTTTNGLYSPATNQIAITTSGTGRLLIDSSGRVGIGTTSPFGKLHVQDDSSDLEMFLIGPSAGSTRIRFGDSADTNIGQIIYDNTSDSLQIHTNNAERARIDSSGRLGVGTSAPTAKLQINVQDGFRFDVGAGAYSYMQFGSAGTGEATAELGFNRSTGKISLKYGNTGSTLSEYITVDNTGRVGIGTTSPGVPLDVVGAVRSTSGTIDARLQAGYSGAVGIGAQSNDAVLFIQNATERARIDSLGRFGIGTSSPSQKLSIGNGSMFIQNSSGAAVSDLGITFALDANTQGRIYSPSGKSFAIQAGTAGSLTDALTVDQSRRVGIGTSSVTNLLHIRSDSASAVDHLYIQNRNGGASSGARIAFSNGTVDYSDNRYAYIGAVNTGAAENGNSLIFATNPNGQGPSERLSITSAGNVGIGTSSPSFALDVSGSGTQTIRAITTDTTGTAIGRFRAVYTGGGGGTQSAVDLRAGDAYGYLTTEGSVPLLFGVNLQERARIDSSGTFRVKGAGTAGLSDAFAVNGSAPANSAQIDSSGRLLVGTSSALSVNSVNAGVEVHSTATNNGASISIARFNNDTSGPQLILGKSRNTTVAAGTIVQNNDDLGQLVFNGDDGTDLNSIAARIQAFVDGTPGADDMPGRLVFSTTSDGASSPTERLRITNDGVMCYDQAAPVSYAAAATLVVGDLKNGLVQYTGAAATLTLPTGTLTEGGFSGIYTNMTFEWSVINTGSGTCTIGAGTGHTIVGGATVAAGASGRFASRRTAANTFVSYRLS